MDITFANNRIKKICNNATGKLETRLAELRAANNLAVMSTLPGRTHPLKANRSGQWSIDLDHPYRLVFKPVNASPNGWDGAQEVTAIQILEKVDYHE